MNGLRNVPGYRVAFRSRMYALIMVNRSRPMISESSQPVFVSLYRRAFREFGTLALWSSRPVSHPTPVDALAITRSLRVDGNLAARRLAEQIEQACHDAH